MGFSFTVNANLFHPAIPRPVILYFHAAVFSSWLVFFILQSAPRAYAQRALASYPRLVRRRVGSAMI